MNNYHIDQTSRTLSRVAIAGILVGSCLPYDRNNEPSPNTAYSLAGENYTSAHYGTSPTHDQKQNILTGHPKSYEETKFEAVLTNFYEQLSSNQEVLGHEFEQVLYENIWDLYNS